LVSDSSRFQADFQSSDPVEHGYAGSAKYTATFDSPDAIWRRLSDLEPRFVCKACGKCRAGVRLKVMQRPPIIDSEILERELALSIVKGAAATKAKKLFVASRRDRQPCILPGNSDSGTVLPPA